MAWNATSSLLTTRSLTSISRPPTNQASAMVRESTPYAPATRPDTSGPSVTSGTNSGSIHAIAPMATAATVTVTARVLMRSTVRAPARRRVGRGFAPESTRRLISESAFTTYGGRMRGIPAPRGPDAALAAVLAIWWVAEVGDLDTVGAVSLGLMTIP